MLGLSFLLVLFHRVRKDIYPHTYTRLSHASSCTFQILVSASPKDFDSATYLLILILLQFFEFQEA